MSVFLPLSPKIAFCRILGRIFLLLNKGPLFGPFFSPFFEIACRDGFFSPTAFGLSMGFAKRSGTEKSNRWVSQPMGFALHFKL